MIIDLILERKAGAPYDANKFYREVLVYEEIFNLPRNISMALDYGCNGEVITALCAYIEDLGYNRRIKIYIAACDWV